MKTIILRPFYFFRNEYSKKVLSDYNKHNECEFQSIISNITSKIHTEESSENELNIDIQLPNLSKGKLQWCYDALVV